jgi:ATP-grasp domain, R2K clade family 3
MITLLFPSEPYELKSVDPDFEKERAAAQACGFDTILIDTDEMRVASQGRQGLCLYRGWMLTPRKYGEVSALLAQRGLRLLTSPDEYRRCHYLPDWYDSLKEHTPETIWTTGTDYDLHSIASHFGAKPIVIKDYVKSAKHYWKEACFVPNAQDREQLQSVLTNFLELRDGEPEGGLVFREFLDLKGIGTHKVSGMPLTLEYRLFFFKCRLLASSRYWGEGDYPNIEVPSELIQKAAPLVDSPFFTMDVACDVADRWWIIEVGDGQVSGLPEGLDPTTFYSKLWTLVGD